MSWLAAKGLLGLARWAWVAVIAAVIAVGVIVVDNAFEDTLETAKEAGASGAVVAGQNQTLEQVGKANEATTDFRLDTGHVRFCECLRSASPATAGNCVRYLNDEPMPGRSDDPGASCPR